MGKIVEFRNLRNEKHIPLKQMDYERTAYYKEMLEDKMYIMDMLFMETEEMLNAYGYDPRKFHLVEKSAKSFLSADMEEFMSGGEESLELSYEAEIDGVIYRTYVSAQCDGEENVEVIGQLLKWDGNEWLDREDEDVWVRGPGADFFG